MLSTQINKYSCYYLTCQKTFSTKFNLRRHINVSHLAIKAYVCTVCHKKFASKQNLKEHMYIHTGEKPFHCQISGCGKQFRQASQLSFHKKAHYRIGAHPLSEKIWPVGSLLSLLAASIEDDDATYTLPCKSESALTMPQVNEERRRVEWRLPIAPGLLE